MHVFTYVWSICLSHVHARAVFPANGNGALGKPPNSRQSKPYKIPPLSHFFQFPDQTFKPYNPHTSNSHLPIEFTFSEQHRSNNNNNQTRIPNRSDQENLDKDINKINQPRLALAGSIISSPRRQIFKFSKGDNGPEKDETTEAASSRR
ncbi:hypothetical protein NC651_009281 [Populus alba x Populus x berolinensis]|nr:hypothetical protein NC651_009281 [Populus alba x Populus x berolinensis]